MLIPGKSHSQVERCYSQVSIETLDFARVRNFCRRRRDRSWITSGARNGEGEGRSGAGWRSSLPLRAPANDLTPITLTSDARPYRRVWTIDWQRAVARPKRRKTAGGAWPGKCNGHWPLDNRPTSRADGSVKQRAAVWSLVPWHTCRNTGWERDRRLAPGYGKSTGPLWDAARQSADIAAVNSDLSCFLYRGRLKRPHLHCQADAVE